MNTKVLITDRDSLFLNIAHEKLSDRGFDVTSASCATEAIEYLKRDSFDSVMVSNIDDKIAIECFIGKLKKKPFILESMTNNASLSPAISSNQF